MQLSMSIGNQPIMNIQNKLNFDQSFSHRKDKVIFIIGATGTGKSRLAIDLATRFPAEIINSDKMQVYKGLNIVTNKVTEQESHGIPHHLLGTIDPNADFTSNDFINHASLSIDSILRRGRLPIIAGGSNSSIHALANNIDSNISLRYDFCFIWVDVSLHVLHSFVSHRVDDMMKRGLVDEVREIFDPRADYSKGIRRAIGVPELHAYLHAEYNNVDSRTRVRMLEKATAKIKHNTCMLACKQLYNIHKIYGCYRWRMKRIDATQVLLSSVDEADEKWEKLVVGPSCMVVEQFWNDQRHYFATNSKGPTVVAVRS